MRMLARFDPWAIAVLLATLMLAAWAAGYWRGSRIRARGGTLVPGKLEDASLALLGLLLAFTFAMAVGKHDLRREAVVSDTNAIGDFHACARLLPSSIRGRLLPLVREYTQLRLDLARRGVGDAGLERSLHWVTEMHDKMTDLVAEAVDGGTLVATPLVNTLNALTSSHAARLAAAKERLPPPILFLLMLAAVASIGMFGMGHGAAGRAHVPGLLNFTLLVCLVVYVVLDLNQPSKGWITVSQEPMERLLSSMAR